MEPAVSAFIQYLENAVPSTCDPLATWIYRVHWIVSISLRLSRNSSAAGMPFSNAFFNAVGTPAHWRCMAQKRQRFLALILVRVSEIPLATKARCRDFPSLQSLRSVAGSVTCGRVQCGSFLIGGSVYHLSSHSACYAWQMKAALKQAELQSCQNSRIFH